jgi:predicted anti-sigma-YlaC factor YlaD
MRSPVCRGNWTSGWIDPDNVEQLDEREFEDAPTSCTVARELISADADAALGDVEVARLDRHLDRCPDCAAYGQRVASLARATRVRAVTAEPGVVDAVMVRAHATRRHRGSWLRPALAWCALLLIVESVPSLVFGDLGGTPTHVARHVGASTLALAVGLLYVVWRPHRAAGLLPFVGALFVSMSAAAVFDVLAGSRSPMSELAHLAELVGMVLLWMIAGSPGWHRIERLVTFGRRGIASSTS